MTDEAASTATVAPRYPIVDSVSLSRPQRSGLLGMRKASRSPAEMVRPGEGHHVLVYRVDGEYVLDDASLDSRHDTVVRASHVTVVDTQRNAPIIVRAQHPGQAVAVLHRPGHLRLHRGGSACRRPPGPEGPAAAAHQLPAQLLQRDADGAGLHH